MQGLFKTDKKAKSCAAGHVGAVLIN